MGYWFAFLVGAFAMLATTALNSTKWEKALWWLSVLWTTAVLATLLIIFVNGIAALL